MLIAQITDMHIKAPGVLLYNRIDTAGYLDRAVAHLMKLDPLPDIVLATGDLVDGGKPEEYAFLRRMLAPISMPLYVIPGNHDARDAMRAGFPDHKYLPASGYLQYVIEDHPLRLIALDTLVDGMGHGEMGAEQLDWLEARLGESKKPTVLFMHHPPFDTGVAFFDGHKLNVGAERFAEIVRRHPHVESVMCGHVHRPIQTRFAGTLGSTAPSTAHQAALNLLPGAPLTMMMEPPGMALHYWQPSAGLVTHTSVIGDFEGPKPFRAM